MSQTGRLPDSMAPCGVYCGACPSFGKGCRGCGSENRKQRRTSKWNCKIRRCCFEEKGLALCSQCTDFPCRLTDKLQRSYPGNERFRYRHEIYENLREIQRQGLDAWLLGEEEKRRCPICGKTIVFYHYRCPACGHEPDRKG
ncbi:DUF3795 domain-containing protein [Methanoculleus sp.]|uniref:DUF3795 domain-containing protein n=1 Tax=Methanoculleus sp. TaxID=90427 RepID=UPI001BD49E30|nr:DUF3795 domain-containing protein [Methanoculleus sp.]